MYLSIEAVKSAQNLDSIVRNAAAEAMARAIDKAILYGGTQAERQGEFSPDGIWFDDSIATISAQDFEDDPTGYDLLIAAKGELLKLNASPTVYAINPATDTRLSLIKDLQGNYLAVPDSLKDMSKVVSNTLNTDSETGVSDCLVMDPTGVVIGMQNNITLETMQDEACLKRGLYAFRIYAQLDAKVVQPKKIIKVTI